MLQFLMVIGLNPVANIMIFCRTADAIWTTATHCIKKQLERSGLKYEFSQLPHEKLFELLGS